MKKLDLSEWKEFALGELFDIVKGTRLTKQDMKEGSINYIGATAFNNGITNHIGNDEHVHPAGTITVTYNGSIGQTFYQEEPYWATDDVNVLYPRFEMTKYIALFIAPLIRSVGKNYVYTDKWQIEDMKRSTIFLPITKEGKPDFCYMNSYMQKLESVSQTTIYQLLTIIEGGVRTINTAKWKFFKISDYFETCNTGNILARDIEDGTGRTPYVTASSVNNGILAHIDATGYKIIKGNCILVGGKTFTLTYQPDDFVSNDSHNFDMRLKNVVAGKNIYLFLITVLRCMFSERYSWGDAVTKEKIINRDILLPSNGDNTPDWNCMEMWVQGISSVRVANFFYNLYNDTTLPSRSILQS